MIVGATLGSVLVASRSAEAAQSWIVGGVQLIDRKFPASWCPYEFVRFTALDSQATLVFEASNLSNPTDPYDHLLDNLMVVERTTWDAFASVSASGNAVTVPPPNSSLSAAARSSNSAWM